MSDMVEVPHATILHIDRTQPLDGVVAIVRDVEVTEGRGATYGVKGKGLRVKGKGKGKGKREGKKLRVRSQERD